MNQLNALSNRVEYCDVLLSIFLARKYVPGFCSIRARGRPKSDTLKLAQLLVDAEIVKLSRRRLKLPDTDRQIVEVLVAKVPYSRRWKRYNRRTLQNMLTASRDRKRNPLVWLVQRYPLEEVRKWLFDLPEYHEN
jgi:hypothetical protein